MNQTFKLTILSAFEREPVAEEEIKCGDIHDAVLTARDYFHKYGCTHKDGYYFELSTGGKLAYSSIMGYIGEFDRV